jgi:hypothetical protein
MRKTRVGNKRWAIRNGRTKRKAKVENTAGGDGDKGSGTKNNEKSNKQLTPHPSFQTKN